MSQNNILDFYLSKCQKHYSKYIDEYSGRIKTDPKSIEWVAHFAINPLLGEFDNNVILASVVIFCCE